MARQQVMLLLLPAVERDATGCEWHALLYDRHTAPLRPCSSTAWTPALVGQECLTTAVQVASVSPPPSNSMDHPPENSKSRAQPG